MARIATTGTLKRRRRGSRWLSLVLMALLSAWIGMGWGSWGLSSPHPEAAEFDWGIPYGLPAPPVPADNPMNSAKVELGQHLFYDPRLSVTGTLSCAGCHRQELAFAEDRAVSIGATGEVHPRNSMSLTNVGYTPVLTWGNPLLRRLEQQALIPLFGEHPVEMGMVGREREILQLLQMDPVYQQLFPQAFPGDIKPTLAHLVRALAAFQRTLISLGSPYDRYRFGRDPNAISASARRGEQLFHGEKLGCFHCHGGFNFSDSLQHERMKFVEIGFHNTGLYNLDAQGSYPFPNTGVYEITGNPADMGRFKAPTLRNIALTAPYMHDGSIATLKEVIAHYAAGGRTLHAGPWAGVGSKNPWKSQFVTGFEITTQEQADLLAFLESLTDLSFTTNPKLANPWKG
ncbi:MAG: di-heme enzyme [Thermostichus sp. DG02_5_bins_236]